MLVYTQRAGVLTAHELHCDAVVSDLKTYRSDTVMYGGVVLEGDLLVQDTALDTDAVVDVDVYVPPDHARRTLHAEVPIHYSLAGITDHGVFVTVSAHDGLATLHIDSPQVIRHLPFFDRFYGGIIALHVAKGEESAYLLTTSHIVKIVLEGNRLESSARGGCGDPITLISCEDGAGVVQVYCLSSSREDLICENIAKGVLGTVVLSLGFSLCRATAYSGVPGERIAVAYDEGVHVYSLENRTKLFAASLTTPPIDVVAPDLHHLLVLYKDHLTLLRLDRDDDNGTEQIRLPFDPIHPVRICEGGGVLAVLSRYMMFVLK